MSKPLLNIVFLHVDCKTLSDLWLFLYFDFLSVAGIYSVVYSLSLFSYDCQLLLILWYVGFILYISVTSANTCMHMGEWVEFTGGQRILKPTILDSQGRAP